MSFFCQKVLNWRSSGGYTPLHIAAINQASQVPWTGTQTKTETEIETETETQFETETEIETETDTDTETETEKETETDKETVPDILWMEGTSIRFIRGSQAFSLLMMDYRADRKVRDFSGENHI